MKRLTMSVIAAGIITAGAAARAGDENDWPCWRGPGGDGKTRVTGIRTDWSDGLTRLWEAKDLCKKGSSWAAPVIKGNRLVVVGHEVIKPPVVVSYKVTEPGRGRDLVFCFDADTGKPLWQTGYEFEVKHHFHQAHTGPHGTPYIDGDRVYTQGAFGQVACWNLADGKQVWMKDLTEEGGQPSAYGYCTSPLVHGDVVVVQGGGKCQVIAFKKATGEVAWKTGEGEATYAAPVSASINGQEQVVVATGGVVEGLEPATGKVLWSFPFTLRYLHHVQTTPVVAGNIVLVSTSYRTKATKVVRIEENNKVTGLWEGSQLCSCQSTPIVIDGYLYCWSDGSAWSPGSLKCINLLTGEEKWATPRTEKNHQKGELVFVDGLLLDKTFSSTLQLWKVSPEGFKKVTEWEIPNGRRSAAYTTPVVARGKLYVRDHVLLTCYELKVPAGPTTRPAAD